MKGQKKRMDKERESMKESRLTERKKETSHSSIQKNDKMDRKLSRLKREKGTVKAYGDKQRK